MSHLVPGVDTVVSSVVGMSVPVSARMTLMMLTPTLPLIWKTTSAHYISLSHVFPPF